MDFSSYCLQPLKTISDSETISSAYCFRAYCFDVLNYRTTESARKTWQNREISNWTSWYPIKDLFSFFSPYNLFNKHLLYLSYPLLYFELLYCTKNEVFHKNFFSKLKKSLMENFISCAVLGTGIFRENFTKAASETN